MVKLKIHYRNRQLRHGFALNSHATADGVAMDEKYRMDSATDVEEDDVPVVKEDEEFELEEARRWQSSPVEERIRLSFSHASHTDNPYRLAGLFSATITAFTVESYKWLVEEPESSTAQLMAYLTAELTKNSGPLPESLVVPPFELSTTEIRINAVWFLSLTLSLTTVLIGILCLQWLREYQRDGTLPHKEAVALRQMRFEGLIYWRVPEILSLLPLILQVSLVLFFVGLLDLLWSRNRFVAACVTIAVGIVLLFIIITTALPTIQQILTSNEHLRIAQCPYKSPQSWLFYRFTNALFLLATKFLGLPWSKTRDSSRFYRLLKASLDTDWLAFDMRWRGLRDASVVIRGNPKDTKDGADLHDALHWLNANFAQQNVDAVQPLHSCLTSKLEIPSAEQAIARMYLDLGQMDAATFRVMLDDRYSPGEMQKRDIISAFYLHLHQDAHPKLKNAYVEAVVRILNTQHVPEPFHDWLTEILIELSGKVVVAIPGGGAGGAGGRTVRRQGTFTEFDKQRPSTTKGEERATAAIGKRHQLMHEDEEVLVQVLMCVRGLITLDRLRVLDVVMAWNLIYYLLYGFSDQPQVLIDAHSRGAGARISTADIFVDDGRRKALNPETKDQYMELVLSIVEALIEWLGKGKQMDRWERVKLCAEGVLKVFPPAVLTAFSATTSTGYVPFEPPQMDQEAMEEEEHPMMSVVGLVRALDDHMLRMGGAPAVFQREKWWHEFWDSRFSGEEWRVLLDALANI
ncbi:hypothetical protein EST38_g8506 [Candolleomyces aberdarensis]|uniref:DUF6535 domain-containing protein n=1 Tax=Candolleomyces aberdarensis TaxID=2316362 RepID=A0A4Q2DCG1_9AGAR|nr:hypothetical protein EST38_g8506 [Candolleomyces aberdarensis]